MQNILVPPAFIDLMYFKYEQTCKRARNLLDYMTDKLYIVEDKKGQAEVNCFGHAVLLSGNAENMLEKLLSMDKLSAENYELLAFYEDTEDAIYFFAELYRSEEEGLISLSYDDYKLLSVLANFEESDKISKEEYLEEFFARQDKKEGTTES